MKTKFTFGLLFLAALVSLVCLVSHPTPKPAIQTQETVLNPEPPAEKLNAIPAQTEILTGYNWQVGDRAAWDLKTSVRFASLDDADDAQVTTVLGKLEMEVISVTADSIQLLACMQDPQCWTAGEATPMLAGLFLNPCLITVETNGKLKTLAFPASVAEDDRRVLKLVYGWPGQIVVRPSQSYFETDDAEGNLGASYSREKETIVKSRMRKGFPLNSDYEQILSSRFNGRIGHLWMAELNGSEDAELIMNSAPFVRATIWVNLNEVDAASRSPILEQWASQLQLLVPQADPAAHSISLALRQEALRERWSTVPLTEVATAIKPGDGIEKNVGHLNDFREWVLVHGNDGVNEVLSLLADPATQPELTGLLTHALATADGDSARKGHIAILENHELFPETVVNQALVSAGQQEIATPELVEAVGQILKWRDDPQSVGLLAAAALARQNPEMAKMLVERVLPDLNEGSSNESVESSLAALRQSRIRDPLVKAAVERWQSSEDPDIHLAVVKYLYAVSDKPELVAQQYLRDPDPRIKRLFDQTGQQ